MAAIVLMRLEPLNQRLFATTTHEMAAVSGTTPDDNMVVLRSIMASFLPHHQLGAQQQHDETQAHQQPMAISPTCTSTPEITNRIDSEGNVAVVHSAITSPTTAATPVNDGGSSEAVEEVPTSPTASTAVSSPTNGTLDAPSPRVAHTRPSTSTSSVDAEPVDAAMVISNAATTFQLHRTPLLRIFKYFATLRKTKRSTGGKVPERRTITRPEWLVFTSTFGISQPTHQAASSKGLLTTSQACDVFDDVRSIFESRNDSDRPKAIFEVDFPKFLALVWAAGQSCRSIVNTRWTFSDAAVLGIASPQRWDVDEALGHAICAHLFDTAIPALKSKSRAQPLNAAHAIPLQNSLALGQTIPPQYSLSMTNTFHSPTGSASSALDVLEILDSVLLAAVGVHFLQPIDRRQAVPGGTMSSSAQEAKPKKAARMKLAKPASHLQLYAHKRQQKQHNKKRHKQSEEVQAAERAKQAQAKSENRHRKNKLKLEEYMKQREAQKRQQLENEAEAAKRKARQARKAAAAAAKRRQRDKQRIAEHHQHRMREQQQEEENVAKKAPETTKAQRARRKKLEERKRAKLAAWKEEQAEAAQHLSLIHI